MDTEFSPENVKLTFRIVFESLIINLLIRYFFTPLIIKVLLVSTGYFLIVGYTKSTLMNIITIVSCN